MKRAGLVLGLLLATTVAVPAHAQTAAFSVTGAEANLSNPPFTLGYAFSLSQAFSATGLGIFDQAGDGLILSHDIGLWDSGGTLLASTTLSGTAGTLVNGFRYGAISPLLLGPGNYTIGATFTGGEDAMVFDATSITPSTGFSYGGSRYASGAALTWPTANDPNTDGYFGPNLLGTAVPEPATWALLLLGFGAIGGAMRSRRQKVAVTYA